MTKWQEAGTLEVQSGLVQGPSISETNYTWYVDRARQYLFIDLLGMISDDDLLREVPHMWEIIPDLIDYNTVVDARQAGGESNWSWQAMSELGDIWKQYADGRNRDKRVAIVTDNFWITQLVNNAFGLIFPGSRFKCFKNVGAAEAWALEDRSARP